MKAVEKAAPVGDRDGDASLMFYPAHAARHRALNDLLQATCFSMAPKIEGEARVCRPTPPIGLSCWAELTGSEPHVRVHVARAPDGAVLIAEDTGTQHPLGLPNGLDCALMWAVTNGMPAFRAAQVPADPYAGEVRLRLEAPDIVPVRFRTHWEPRSRSPSQACSSEAAPDDFRQAERKPMRRPVPAPIINALMVAEVTLQADGAFGWLTSITQTVRSDLPHAAETLATAQASADAGSFPPKGG